MQKTVFISSTFRDLAGHRRAVWDLLGGFDATVRGMEQFGARPDTPLDTCLAEVEQSDVYIGIVAFRAGSIHRASGKSFTQLEYEHAVELQKEILIYLADEQNASVRYVDVDTESVLIEKLRSFKRVLRERHTVDTFTSPEDLVEKLRTALAKYLDPREPASEDGAPKDEFDATLTLVRRFLLMPKTVVGREALFRIHFYGQPFPASRQLCQAFNLEYGGTVGYNINVREPRLSKREFVPFKYLFATGRKANTLIDLLAEKRPKEAMVFARLQFAEQDIESYHGRFFGHTVYENEEHYDEEYPGARYIPPEGETMLLFSKVAS